MTIAKSRTKERLMAQAERLFAQKGIAECSVRDITAAAQANLGAITYYFGSKDGLVRAVCERRLGPLNEERLRLLKAAEAGSKPAPASLESVLHAAIAPTIRLMRENPNFLRIVGRLVFDPKAAFKRHAEFKSKFERFLRAIVAALPGIPLREIIWRILFLRGSIIQTWMGVKQISALTGFRLRSGSDEEIVRRLIEFGSAGLRASVGRREKSGLRRQGRGGTSHHRSGQTPTEFSEGPLPSGDWAGRSGLLRLPPLHGASAL